MVCYDKCNQRKGVEIMTTNKDVPVIEIEKPKKKRFTSYIETELHEKLCQLSDDTRVPITAYVTEAIEDLLKKYNR